jgi:hypothetical protein
MIPYEKLPPEVKKQHDFYEIKPDAPIIQSPSWFISLDKWKAEGHISQDIDDTDLKRLFGYEPSGIYGMGNLGHSDPAYVPFFGEKVIEDQGDYVIVQDEFGKHVKLFKNEGVFKALGNTYMPEYLEHPVKDIKTWEENCLWRLNPDSPERNEGIERSIKEGKEAAAKGYYIGVDMVGGYMYLRSLIGTTNLLFFFYDKPELIHLCMTAWFNLADSVLARYQNELDIDTISIGEDISYKNGLLISPDMVREFLFVYYQQLLKNVKDRNHDKTKTLHFEVDSDGNNDTFIPLYMEIGMDCAEPVEGAAGIEISAIAK